jgi:hypothetical protein
MFAFGERNMQTRFRLFTLVAPAVLAVSLFASASRAADASKSSKPKPDTNLNEEMLAFIRAGLKEAKGANSDREPDFVLVTAKPFHVISPSAVLCASPRMVRRAQASPHNGHWIDVYVSRAGYGTMMSGKGTYPPGTIILKQKFQDAAGTQTELFTGMLKREKGYAPQTGDWQFFALNSDATAITSAGNVQSCINCHAPLRATDFVSRRYLIDKVAVRK